ncbi:hypothetical protein KA005_41450, partial [bacterium]|nr:hypothetical protein [bacterium]
KKMSGLLLFVLHDIRFRSGWPTIIHCGTQGKHCKGSYHYKGMAVDFHFVVPNSSISFRDQSKFLMQYLVDMQLDNFVGLGIYPEWNNPGFHLDTRGKKARWLKQGGEYVALNRF